MSILISFSDKFSPIEIKETDLSVTICQAKDPEDWGDDDCEKLVTPVTHAVITLSKSFCDKHLNDNNERTITMIRYGYYNPCYKFTTPQVWSRLSDGSIKVEI